MKKVVVFLCILAIGSALAVYIDSDGGAIGVGADNQGNFSIGVPPMPPLYPDIRNLLNTDYTAASPAGAYVGFLIDSVIYSTSGIVPLMFPDTTVYLSDHILAPSYIDPINKWIMTEWSIEDDPYGADSIYISQILQPQESGGSGTVVMRWLIRNDSSVPHSVGIILAMDTKIGDSDDAKIWAPGIPFSDTARVLPSAVHDWDLPPFWEAYEYDPPDDTLGLVAKGILTMPPNTPPTKIAMADWRDLLGQYWDVSIPEVPYDDSGVMLWWYPVTVQPGSLTICMTSYGLSDSSASIGGIYSMSISYPRNQVVEGCRLLPNPFNLVVGVTNTSDSTVYDMQAYLDCSSSSFLTVSSSDSALKYTSPCTLSTGQVGFVSWGVVSDPAPLTSTIDYFQVTARSTLRDTFTTSPPMPIQVEGSDYLGPYAELIEPLFNTISSDSLQPIKIYLHDDDVGVDTSRIFFYFLLSLDDTIGVDISDPRLRYENDTLYYTPSEALINGTYYYFELFRAEDLNGCPTSSVITGRFLCDLIGPEIEGHFPPDSSIQTDSLLVNYVLAIDALGELRLQTVQYDLILDYYLSGVSVTGDIPADGISIGTATGVGLADSVFWAPGSWTSGYGRIPDGYVDINMVGLTDDPDYGTPNPSPDLPYGWWYLMNSHGPRAHPVLPYDEDYVSVPDTDMVYYLYDGNSLDMTTAQISFDGTTQAVAGACRDSLHTVTVSTLFADGYLVEVEVLSCDDSLGTPLDIISHTEWAYTIDISAPEISSCTYDCYDSVGTDSFDVIVHLDDTYAGVNPDSLDVLINGLPPTALTWAGDSAVFTVVTLDDSVVIDLTVCDLIDVGPANWLDTSFVLYIVMEGPRASFAGLSSGYICSATGPIIWNLYDPDGIVTSSIEVTVSGVTYTLSDPELSYIAMPGELTYTPSSAWTDGFLVTASLDAAEDPYGYSLASPVSGTWEVDLDPPDWTETIEEVHTSTGGSSYDMFDSLLNIHIQWGDGALDSISLVFDGIFFEAGSLGLTIEDTVISFSAPDADIMLDSGATYDLVLIAKTVCAFNEGEWDTHTVVFYSTDIDEKNRNLPTTAELLPNRPDPFNASTIIPFILPKTEVVRVEISDMLGRHVITLVDNRLDAGRHEIIWKGVDDLGRQAPSGVYNCRLIAGGEIHSQRITLIR